MTFNPGYTHRVSFEQFAPAARMWCLCTFRTTRDAVHIHLSALRIRVHGGEVRNVHVNKLVDTNAAR